MNQALYDKYWGKADEPLKAAYSLGQDKKEIVDKFKAQLARNLKLSESQIRECHLDEWAERVDKQKGKAKWIYCQDNYSAYHLFPYHCLDVAAVADLWWEANRSLRQQFTKTMRVKNEERAKPWVMFFVALHDLGKLDIRFQCKAPYVLKELQSDITHYLQEPYYHGTSSYACFINEKTLYGIDFMAEDAAIEWLQQVAGHHGVIPYDGDYIAPAFTDETLKKRDQQARIDWINALKQLYQVDLNAVPENVPPMLAGFCSVCDWIGSSTEYFAYVTDPTKSLGDYLESRKTQAKQALMAFGILSELKANKTLASLFHSLDGLPYKPHGLQTLIEDLPLVQSLILIEAPTGSGKTETALVYAARLLHEGLADSIIFALPTQATANAMLDRLEALAGNLYFEGASVVLAHGKSKLKDALEKILSNDKTTAQGQEEANQQAVRWLTASKKRAFLGQIGVCTIDQVLLSVLPVKHKFVRSFGIQKSVLIVDEVHAYDSYMYGLLEVVLKQQYQAGGSALLLSATLPQQQREYLASSWGNAKIEETDTYPLITQIYSDQTAQPFSITDSQHLPEPRQVNLETWQSLEMQFYEEHRKVIIEAAKQGAKVAVICNLVADAQQLAEKLRAETSIAVDLFHSRFRFIDRKQLEEKVVKDYGKDENKRAQGGRILVATQVVEQSLDLDFDWLITQLCPVDLLFQRMGRLHRHQRSRPSGFELPRCVVIVPEQEQKYGGSQYVYKNSRALWRTEQLVRNNNSVIFPEAYRDWLERVYQSNPWPDEPEAVTAAYQNYLEKVQEVAKMAAKLMTKLKTEPLSDESDKATTLTRDGEMSLIVLPVLARDSKFYTFENERLDEQSKQYWEQVSLNSIGVPNSWKKVFSSCSKKDGVIYLPMQTDTVGWCLELDGQRVVYQKDLGLFVEND